MTRIPRKLELSVTADGEPLEGAWIELTLLMRAKNDLNLLVGPTDAAGRLTATAKELMRQIQATCDSFPMDYGGMDDWSGRVEAAVLNREDVRRVLAAVETWGLGLGIRSMEDLDRLVAYGRRLEAIRGHRLEVQVTDSGGGVQVAACAKDA